jgi:hypothetical protein
MRSRFNSLSLGLIVGILIPFLSLLFFYTTNFAKVSFVFFLLHTTQIEVLPKLISLCGIPNLGVFFLFIWRNHYYSARGVIFATLFLTFLVLVLMILT